MSRRGYFVEAGTGESSPLKGSDGLGDMVKWDATGGVGLDDARATHTPSISHPKDPPPYNNSGAAYVVSTSPLLGTRLVKPLGVSPSAGQVQEKRYRVGGSCEWAISGTQRICWILAGCMGVHRGWGLGCHV